MQHAELPRYLGASGPEHCILSHECGMFMETCPPLQPHQLAVVHSVALHVDLSLPCPAWYRYVHVTKNDNVILSKCPCVLIRWC